jgi:hypothetical protein
MKVASDQPSFLPWAGFWNKLLNVDLMIYSIGVPASYGSRDHYHNRVKLNGSWLTVPVTNSHNALFKDIRFDLDALPKIAKTIRNSFGKKFPYRDRVWRIADMIDAAHLNSLWDFNAMLIEEMLIEMCSKRQICLDEEVPDQSMTKTERLIARIRRHVQEGPIEYHLGRGALDYIDAKVMAANGIDLFVQVMSPGVKDETGLQLIAQDFDPMREFQRMGSWERLGP